MDDPNNEVRENEPISTELDTLGESTTEVEAAATEPSAPVLDPEAEEGDAEEVEG